jgi:hypothetical protein
VSVSTLLILLALATAQYGGTFIAAVICSDGIVIASDSRTTFNDGEGKAFGFLDGMPKIYVDRDAAIAVSGMSSMNGELLSSFVKRNQFLLERPVNEILFGFGLYLPLANANDTGMISAGFVDGKPMICVRTPVLSPTCSNTGFVSNKNSPVLRDTLVRLNATPTMAQAMEALKSAIEEASRTDPTVGGPISMLKLSSNAPPQWSGAPISDGGITQICDLVRKRRAEIVPVGAQGDLDLHLNAACPRPK